MQAYTIGDLAKAAIVPVSTVRFYERNGIVTPDGRTGANDRQYGEQTLDRLKFIRAAQSTGFSVCGTAILFNPVELQSRHGVSE